MSSPLAPPTDGVIDFTVPPELKELLARVRAFVEEDVLPAESEIEDPHDVLKSWHVVERLRDRGAAVGAVALALVGVDRTAREDPDAGHEARRVRALHEQDLERRGVPAQQDHGRRLPRDDLLAGRTERLAAAAHLLDGGAVPGLLVGHRRTLSGGYPWARERHGDR